MDKLQAAIDAFHGKQAGLADVLGVTQGAISHWITGRSKPNALIVRRLEAATGISRHDLRPDIFGPPSEGVRDAA